MAHCFSDCVTFRHNSFISTWKLADSYGMAGIFADHALEMVRCDRPTGEAAPVKFLYPELGRIDPNAPREKRMEFVPSPLMRYPLLSDHQ